METRIYTSSPEFRLRRAVDNICEGFARRPLWMSLGWLEIKQRYRRSIIGPLWITLSLAIMIAGLGIIYSSLFNMETHAYIPFLSTGLIIWGLIAGLVTDGCMVFLSSEGILKQLPVPLFVHVLRTTWKHVIIFCHNIVIYVAVMIYYGKNPGLVVLLAPLGTAIVVINGIGFCMTLGIVSARFRDIPPIITSFIQLVFFVTPVFWMPEALKNRTMIVDGNPLYYLLEIVRRPLLGQVPAAEYWLVAALFTTVNVTAAYFLFARFRGRIAYWV